MGSADGQLSQAELSCAVDMSSSFLSLLEQGRTDIAIGRLLQLAGFYDVELTDLPVATLEGPQRRGRSRPTGGYSPAAASAGKYGCGILPTAEPVATLEAQSSGMTSVAFSPDEPLLGPTPPSTARCGYATFASGLDLPARNRGGSLGAGLGPLRHHRWNLCRGRRSARCHRALSGTRGTPNSVSKYPFDNKRSGTSAG